MARWLLVLVATLGVASAYETAERAMLGVHMSPPSPATQLANGISSLQGIEVLQIYGETTADRMGLQVGDVILAVNGSEMAMMEDLRNEVQFAGVGGTVEVDLLREGVRMRLSDTVSQWPRHIPFAPLDAEAERRFRAWQGERWHSIGQEVDAVARRIAALKRRPAEDKPRLVSPRQQERLQRIPAFRLRLRTAYDSADRGPASDRAVAWDARVLLTARTSPTTY